MDKTKSQMGEVVATRSETLRDGRGLSPLLPPGEISQSEHIEAPAIGGSFLIINSLRAALQQQRFVRPSVQEDYPYILPSYETRPIDEISGLPYCFAPNPDLPPVLAPGTNYERLADWDHQFPKVETKHGANPLLDLPNARMALMNLRLQWSLFGDHHNEWNVCPSIGPRQPGTPQQLAATLLLGLSGCVPPVGLRLKNRGYIEERLTHEEQRHLWESGQLRIGDEGSIAGYLRWYVLSQEVDHIREAEIEEFLCTFDKERKHYLGHLLAALIIDRAVEPFSDAYSEARKKGQLQVWHPSKKVLVPAPANSRDLLKGQLSRGRQMRVLINGMTERLAKYRRRELAVA